MKNNLRITFVSVILIVLIVIISCEKEDNVSIGKSLNDRTTAIFNSELEYGTVTDIDGNIYKTITIGEQNWMAENLRTTRYRNGNSIPNVKSNSEWNTLTIGAYCNYNNTDNLDTIATYGRLYNWNAISDSRNIAPEGWRVPTASDWETLRSYVEEDCGSLKEIGFTSWISPNGGATNSTGFTALPSGARVPGYSFVNIGYFADYWSSTEYDNLTSIELGLRTDDGACFGGSGTYNGKSIGNAIRCIKE
jgi:uncharacterized protein (TIGR02145 family)